MVSIEHNFMIEQGKTWSVRVQLRDDSMNIIDTTGWRGRMQVRSPLESTTILFDLTTENGKITNSADDGQFTLLLTSNETQSYTVKNAVYDFITIDPDGVVRGILQGAFEMTPCVTRYQLILTDELVFGDDLTTALNP